MYNEKEEEDMGEEEEEKGEVEDHHSMKLQLLSKSSGSSFSDVGHQ